MRAVFFVLMLAMVPLSVRAETVVYLVRHGEAEATDSADRALNPEGRARALWLADYFKNKGITGIYSTDFVRTRQTAGPTAKALELPVEIYAHDQLRTFAQALRSQDGVFLVAGHSNTTPDLVNALIGEERFEWLQHFQHDFIFKIFMDQSGRSRVSIDYSQPRSRYGDHPSEK